MAAEVVAVAVKMQTFLTLLSLVRQVVPEQRAVEVLTYFLAMCSLSMLVAEAAAEEKSTAAEVHVLLVVEEVRVTRAVQAATQVLVEVAEVEEALQY